MRACMLVACVTCARVKNLKAITVIRVDKSKSRVFVITVQTRETDGIMAATEKHMDNESDTKAGKCHV